MCHKRGKKVILRLPHCILIGVCKSCERSRAPLLREVGATGRPSVPGGAAALAACCQCSAEIAVRSQLSEGRPAPATAQAAAAMAAAEAHIEDAISDGCAPASQLGILDLDRSSLSHIFALTLGLHQAALRAAADQERLLALRRHDPRRCVALTVGRCVVSVQDSQR